MQIYFKEQQCQRKRLHNMSREIIVYINQSLPIHWGFLVTDYRNKSNVALTSIVIIIYRIISIYYIYYLYALYMHTQIVPALASCIDLYKIVCIYYIYYLYLC
jgi:hypothetical protein